MNIIRKTKFEIIVSGKQTGAVGKWNKTHLTIESAWGIGEEGEKFEVLAAIRKTYNPENKSDIRGNERHTPSQVGRSEGFKELSYIRTDLSVPWTVIVPPIMQHLKLVSCIAQSKFPQASSSVFFSESQSSH